MMMMMTMKRILGFVTTIVVAHGATITIDWENPAAVTTTANVGDTIIFEWTDALSHNIIWDAGFNSAGFANAPLTASLGHTENYVIPAAADAQTLQAICERHPNSMKAVITVNNSSLTPTASPTGSPSDSPTTSPTPPTPSPTDSPTPSPTPPTPSPTASPTVSGASHSTTISCFLFMFATFFVLFQ